ERYAEGKRVGPGNAYLIVDALRTGKAEASLILEQLDWLQLLQLVTSEYIHLRGVSARHASSIQGNPAVGGGSPCPPASVTGRRVFSGLDGSAEIAPSHDRSDFGETDAVPKVVVRGRVLLDQLELEFAGKVPRGKGSFGL